MKKIIWWLDDFYPILGGGPVYARNIIEGMSNFEHEIITRAIKGQPFQEELSENITIKRFPENKSLNIPVLNNVKVYSYLESLLREIRFISSRINYLKKTDFDLLYLLGMPMHSAIQRFQKLTGINLQSYFVDYSFIQSPKIMTLCNLPHDLNKDLISIESYNHYINQFDNIICLDRHIYDYCNEYINSLEEVKKTWFISNTVDNEKFSYTPIKKTSNLKLGFAGRLADTVDLDMVNYVISNLPENVECHLVVSGDIDLIKIPKEVEQRVNLELNVKPDSMPLFYKKINVLFNPIIHKGVPCVTLEAMSSGRPVIMYNLGNKHVPTHEFDGYLIERDKDKVIELISHLSQNRDKVRSLGIQAKKTIEQKYSNQVIQPIIGEIFSKLIKDGSINS